MSAKAARGLSIVIAVFVLATGTALAQDSSGLRQDIERRFEVLALRDGLLLRPRIAGAVSSIEVEGGTIAIDGRVAAGAEVRDRLGEDADLVIRLSYLDAEAQRRLFDAVPADRGDAAVPLPPEPPAPPSPLPESTRTRRSGDRVRFGGSVRVEADELVTGDVVAIGGSVTVDGEVTGDVVAVGGSVRLGPNADVRGDVAVVGGVLHRSEGARVRGRVSDVGRFDFNWFGPTRRRPGPWWQWMRPWGSVFALMSTTVRFAILSLLVCLVLLLGPTYVERVAARAAAEPLKAGLVGFLAQLLFLPLLVATIVVLVVTIIGIPLLVLVPFAIIGFALVFLIGFAAVSRRLGGVLAARLGWSHRSSYLVAVLGVVVVLSPVLIGRLLGLAGGLLWPLAAVLVAVGFVVEYVAWTVGLGAVALVRFQSPQPGAVATP
jgi:hypothetical protein